MAAIGTIGTFCILVGFSLQLAMSIVQLESNIPTFSSAYSGLHYIMEKQN